ncbi:hypothetical protein BCR44DRAFT_1427852, partial [Catenaria anguillulae PL171]
MARRQKPTTFLLLLALWTATLLPAADATPIYRFLDRRQAWWFSESSSSSSSSVSSSSWAASSPRSTTTSPATSSQFTVTPTSLPAPFTPSSAQVATGVATSTATTTTYIAKPTATILDEEEGGGVQGFPIIGSDGSQVDDELGTLPPPLDDVPAEDEPWEGGEVATIPDPLDGDEGGSPVSFPEDNASPDDDPLTGDQLDDVMREWLNSGGGVAAISGLEANLPKTTVTVTVPNELPTDVEAVIKPSDLPLDVPLTELPTAAAVPTGLLATVTDIAAVAGGFIPPVNGDVIEIPPPTNIAIPTNVPVTLPTDLPAVPTPSPVNDVIEDLVANLPPLPIDVADAIDDILESVTGRPTVSAATATVVPTTTTPTTDDDGTVVGTPSRPTQVPAPRMRTIFSDQFASPQVVAKVWTSVSGQCLASLAPNFCFNSSRVNLNFNSTLGIAQLRPAKQPVTTTSATNSSSLFTGGFIWSGIPLTKAPVRWALDVLVRTPTSLDVQPILALAFGNRVVVNLARGTVNVEQGPSTISTVAEKLASPLPLPYPASAPFASINATQPLRITMTGTSVGRDVLITLYQSRRPPVNKTVTLPSSIATMIQQAESVNKRFAVWPMFGTGISANAAKVDAPAWTGPTNQTGPLSAGDFTGYTLTVDSVRFGVVH